MFRNISQNETPFTYIKMYQTLKGTPKYGGIYNRPLLVDNSHDGHRKNCHGKMSNEVEKN